MESFARPSVTATSTNIRAEIFEDAETLLVGVDEVLSAFQENLITIFNHSALHIILITQQS